MQGKLILYVIGLLVITITALTSCEVEQPKDIEVEYEIELINENLVKVYSLSTEEVYFCTPEQIPEVLWQDNL